MQYGRESGFFCDSDKGSEDMRHSADQKVEAARGLPHEHVTHFVNNHCRQASLSSKQKCISGVWNKKPTAASFPRPPLFTIHRTSITCLESVWCSVQLYKLQKV